MSISFCHLTPMETPRASREGLAGHSGSLDAGIASRGLLWPWWNLPFGLIPGAMSSSYTHSGGIGHADSWKTPVSTESVEGSADAPPLWEWAYIAGTPLSAQCMLGCAPDLPEFFCGVAATEQGGYWSVGSVMTG